MFLSRYSSYVVLLSSYIMLTKNTFRNIYKKLTRSSSVKSALILRKYVPVTFHWFYEATIENQKVWKAFSEFDSHQLENAFLSSDIHTEKIISTDGGRYDVNLLYKIRNPVYWLENSTKVRRCSWFYKSYNDVYFTPFQEHIAEILENEYQAAYETSGWHRVVNLPNGDSIAFNSPDNIILLPSQDFPRQRLVKRGIDDEFEIAENEATEIDHLIFAVHGIGAICDLKLRTIEEVVTILRDQMLKILNKKPSSSNLNIKAKRVEVLPINWHIALHNKNSKTDRNLHSITLESLPLLRNFTNDTIIDILLYTSTIYSQDIKVDEEQSSIRFSTRVPFAQIILTAVTNEVNRIYTLFKERNPKFDGGISFLGHSLGSVIIFDLLCHQISALDIEPNVTERGLFWPNCSSNKINVLSPTHSKTQIDCPQLKFHPQIFFAIGSPIGLFLTIRGIDKLGTEFSLPTCKRFLNIFHPCDPIAYRIEPLIDHGLESTKPFMVPYYGKKYLHIEIKDAVLKIGENVKSSVSNYVKTRYFSILNAIYLSLSGYDIRNASVNVTHNIKKQKSEENDCEKKNFGNINNGQRIDYTLQEGTIECLNKYVCALSGHACYWESLDVLQLILKELYPDSTNQPDNEQTT